MKSILIALGMAAACMTTAAYSSPLTATGSTSFTSLQNTSVSAAKGKKHTTKHAKGKRAHHAAKKV